MCSCVDYENNFNNFGDWSYLLAFWFDTITLLLSKAMLLQATVFLHTGYMGYRYQSEMVNICSLSAILPCGPPYIHIYKHQKHQINETTFYLANF